MLRLYIFYIYIIHSKMELFCKNPEHNQPSGGFLNFLVDLRGSIWFTGYFPVQVQIMAYIYMQMYKKGIIRVSLSAPKEKLYTYILGN